MAGGGGKGGGQTSDTKIPKWLEDASIENIGRASDVQKMGYMPYYGPDVAAFNSMQKQGMQSAMDNASYFGLADPKQNAMAGMPQAQTFDNGMQGYSSGGLYDQAVAELAQRRPGQAAAYNNLFNDPYAAPQQGAPGPGGYVPPEYNPMGGR